MTPLQKLKYLKMIKPYRGNKEYAHAFITSRGYVYLTNDRTLPVVERRNQCVGYIEGSFDMYDTIMEL